MVELAVGQDEQAQGNLVSDMATRSQNQSMLGHPGAMRIIPVHGLSLATTLHRMATGGNAYGSQGRLIASTAIAMESGSSHMNRGYLLDFVASKLLEVGATWCISTEKSLEGEIILSE